MALAHPRPAAAHAIQSTLESLSSLSQASVSSLSPAKGSTLTLASSFSTGVPVAGADVRLVPPAGTPIALGRTDANGHLSFQLPPGARSDWEVQVDGGPGHRDYLELPKTSVPAAAHSLQLPHGIPGSLSHLLPPVLGLGLMGTLVGLKTSRTPRPGFLQRRTPQS
jgi:nickel transport protein